MRIVFKRPGFFKANKGRSGCQIGMDRHMLPMWNYSFKSLSAQIILKISLPFITEYVFEGILSLEWYFLMNISVYFFFLITTSCGSSLGK